MLVFSSKDLKSPAPGAFEAVVPPTEGEGEEGECGESGGEEGECWEGEDAQGE